MTHMHIPDGVLPVRICLLGFLAMFITMAISLIRFRSRDLKREIPLPGAVSAAMLVVMSLEILPIVYHINLSVFFVFPKKLPVFWRTAVATVLTLFITTIALIGMVAASHLEPDLFSYEHQGYGLEQRVVHDEQSSVSRFATMVLILGSVGWIIEAAITGAVISFIARVKPDLLRQVFHRENAHRSGGLRGA
jgi:cobalt/nickel transport system permease protein